MAGRTRLRRGTRAAIVLKEGQIYYPEDTLTSKHSFRRVIGIVRQPGKTPMVVYSVGTDHNHICNRSTFVRWIDPKAAA